MDANAKRLLAGVLKDVQAQWGLGWEQLGPRLQRALLAEAVLSLINRQDDLVTAESVRRIAVDGWEWANKVSNY